ncbi:MAG: hypothetical protein LRZ92_02940 [Methanosarcinaceae archaeon]|jgi:hypothetical protein|nr:hypothetical protein [Methanosarcinaceae archaeon]NKQ39400.1 hypothetical protein [Methanosarcinales archaeon]
MTTSQHPMFEALKDIQEFKLRLTEFFRNKKVFPIKNKTELGNALPCELSLPCGDIEAAVLIDIMADSDFPIKDTGDLTTKLADKCIVKKHENE